jgi:hypothetical protein
MANFLNNAWNFARNELLGVDDFGNAARHARQGNWGKAAKSVGTGALELGGTAAFFVPGAQGLALASKAGKLTRLSKAAPFAARAGQALAQTKPLANAAKFASEHPRLTKGASLAARSAFPLTGLAPYGVKFGRTAFLAGRTGREILNGDQTDADKTTTPSGSSIGDMLRQSWGERGAQAAANTTIAAPAPFDEEAYLPEFENPYADKALSNQMAALQAESARIEAEAARRRQEIAGQFALAPTKQEKEYRDWMLADLEAQRVAAQQAISTAYTTAEDKTRASAERMRTNAATDAAQISTRYADTAQSIRDNQAELTAAQGSAAALGLGMAPISGDAVGAADYAAMSGADSAALAQQLGSIDAATQEFFADALGGQAAAQQGELARTVAGLRAEQTQRWNETVNARINAERMARMDALAALDQMLSQQRAGLAGERRDAQGNYDQYRAARADQLGNLRADAKRTTARSEYDNGVAAWKTATAAASPLGRQAQRLATTPAVQVMTANGPVAVSGAQLSNELMILATDLVGQNKDNQRKLLNEWVMGASRFYGPSIVQDLAAAGINIYALGE